MPKQKCVKIGDSYYIVLAAKWRQEHGIGDKSTVRVFETEDGKLVISPEAGSHAK